MTTDPIVDLVDPIRIIISLLPPTWQAPAAVTVSTLASLVTVASLIVSRLPVSAAQHPRYGWAVRMLHRVSLLRLRDELGSAKLPGADVGPRVTVAPTPLPLAESAGKEGAAVVMLETRGDFDASARQTIAPDVVAVAQRITRESERGYATVRALAAVVVVLAVGAPMGALIAGCPRLPPVSGCQPEAQTCIADSPHVCSASQRWHRAGDISCSAVGGQCLVAGGRAYCAPLADGGVR